MNGGSKDGAPITVGIRYLPHHDGLPPLARMTEGSSGFDLQAACTGGVVIEPGRAVLVQTGFEMAVPPGYEAQVRPRSGLALKSRIGLLNSPGTIDSDFRGEVGVEERARGVGEPGSQLESPEAQPHRVSEHDAEPG